MVKRCTKCDELKPSTEYYTYYHSTQQKWRTRNVCNPCYYLQKKEYKESIKNKKIIEPVVLKLEIEVDIPQPIEEVNPNHRQCKTCEEFKPQEDYYAYSKNGGKLLYLGVCKKCCNKRETDRKKENRQVELEEQGGSEKVLRYPNQYTDEHQRKFTFKIMEVMGWTFNEENEMWYKPGIKSETGIWTNVKNGGKPRPRRIDIHRTTRFKRSEIRNNITPETLPKIKVNPLRVTTNVTEDIVNQMTYDFFINKIKTKELARRYGYDSQMIQYYIDRIYDLF